jgi:hypothetical protein
VLERGGSDQGRRRVEADHSLPPLRLVDRLALRPPEETIRAALEVIGAFPGARILH